MGKRLVRRQTPPCLIRVVCADCVGEQGGTEREKGYPTAMIMLKKVNKSRFVLFSWICGGSTGLKRRLFRGSLTIC